MDGLNCLGAEEDEMGFDYGSLLQGAGGLASGIIASKAEDDAKAKASADEQKAVDASIAADIAASIAAAKADVSAKLKSASASIDATAATMASSVQDRAGSGLSAAGSQKRADAADKALADAVKNAQAKPTDGYLQALVKAWTATSNKAHSGAISGDTGSSKGGKGEGGESFWTRRVVGPLPGYAVVVGGAGLLTGLGFAVKAILRR